MVRGTGTNALANTQARATIRVSFSVAPLSVPDLTVLSQDEQVALTWTGPGPLWAGISIRWTVSYKRSADAVWINAGTGTALARTISGLDNDVSYDFRVRAADADDPSRPASPWSATVSATPSGADVRIPTNFHVERTYVHGTVHAAVVSNFNPPNGGDAPTAYQVRYRAGLPGDGFANWSERVLVSNFAQTRHLFTHLARNTAYILQVRALVGNATGPWATITVTTPYLGIPADFRVVRSYTEGIRSASIVTDFNPPDGGLAPDGYQARYRAGVPNDGGTGWSPWVSVSNFANTGHLFHTLSRNTAHILELRATSGATGIGPTTSITATTPDTPDADIVNVTVSSVSTVPEDGTFQFTVTVEGIFDSYTVVWSIANAGVGSIDPRTGLYSTGDISGDRQASVLVRATVTAVGTGPNAKDGTTAMNSGDEWFSIAYFPAPTVFAVAGNGIVDLTWSNIPAAWTGADVRWTISRKLTSGTVWTNLGAVSTNSYRATGLVNGTSYDFRVRADDAADPTRPDSPWSRTVSATPSAPLPPLRVFANGPYSGLTGASISLDASSTGGVRPFASVYWLSLIHIPSPRDS